MLTNCRFCPVTKNGDLAIKEHERAEHPKEYFLSKADALEKAGQRNLDEAARLRAKWDK